MRKNKINVIINKPIREVFEFTTNPKNTPLWIVNLKEELSSEYPPKINTEYKNRDSSGNWDSYVVVEIEQDKIFTLKAVNGTYYVRYLYRKLNDSKTELEYFEWMEEGDLKNPFSQDVLEKLKEVMEN